MIPLRFASTFGCPSLTALLVAGASLLWSTSPAPAVVFVDMDFETPVPAGGMVSNAGVAGDGLLVNGANVSGGVLNLAGDPDRNARGYLDVSMGALSPFNGNTDWRLQFDFATINNAPGVLFSSDSFDCMAPCASDDDFNFDEQAGSLNIWLTGEGEVVLDFWFIGALGGGIGLNDDAFHTLETIYTADGGFIEMFVDGDLVAEEEEFDYFRDSSLDRTWVGNESNDDLASTTFMDDGVDEGFSGRIDNLLIDAPAPPPFVARVDLDTGMVQVENILDTPVDFNSLTWNSIGDLNPAGYTSIAGNYDAAGDGSVDANNNWQVVEATSEEISENDGSGATGTLAPGQVVQFGTLLQPTPFRDLEAEIFDAGLGETVGVAIAYEGEGVPFGDLDLDGDVDADDWTRFRSGFGSDLDGLTEYEAYLLADLEIDFEHNADDFVVFIEAFDEFNGEGAFAAMTSVPEPSTMMLALLGLAAGSLTRLRCGRRVALGLTGSVLAVAVVLAAGAPARAELLVEYLFSNNFNDTAPAGGSQAPSLIDPFAVIIDGELNFLDPLAIVIVGNFNAINPFDGSSDFTIEFDFTLPDTAIAGNEERSYLIMSSSDPNAGSEPVNHSMSIYVNEFGELIYDNFFVGEVLDETQDYRDGQPHSFQITYTAANEQFFMNVDGDFTAVANFNPEIPDISNDEVIFGASNNTEFPEGDLEGGILDNVRIYNESFAPTQLSLTVDTDDGAAALQGGEFVRELKFYEILSDSESLLPDGWASLGGTGFDAQGSEVGEDWDELDDAPGHLAEGYLLGSSTFDEGTLVELGAIFDAAGAQDLEAFGVTDDNEIFDILVEYCSDCLPAAPPAMREVMGPSLEADFNEDGVVDRADYEIWQSGFGTASGAARGDGDSDEDNDVDGKDFLTWQGQLGAPGGAAAAAAVPEPSSAGLLLATVAHLALRRRRSKPRNI